MQFERKVFDVPTITYCVKLKTFFVCVNGVHYQQSNKRRTK